MKKISTDKSINLIKKALWVWNETLKIHLDAPETRLASSLSVIEIFVALYYGKILKYNASTPLDEELNSLAELITNKAKSNSVDLQDVSHIPNLDHWFRQDVQRSVLSLKREIDLTQSGATKDALMLCLSSILVRVSNQDSDTRYAAIEKSVTGKNVYDFFLASVDKLVTAKLDFIESNK